MEPQSAPVTPLRFGPDGLVPAVAQDAETGDVLMVGFMNEEALAATRTTGRVHYWSRSRNRLWRKGETSGHEQVVERIFVNCEENSLLIKVRQIGAVCHDGYPTCFYRALDPNGALAVTRERAFDPKAVYVAHDSPPDRPSTLIARSSGLAERTRALFGAFAWLRDHDLSADSRTSALLRGDDDRVTQRVTDELEELAGVLDGSHWHDGREQDTLLEGSQVWYWVVLAALRAGLDWHDVRPDLALVADAEVDDTLVARMLRADAERWERSRHDRAELAARSHATLALVAQACRSAGVEPGRIIDRELDASIAKPYLAAYFATVEGA